MKNKLNSRRNFIKQGVLTGLGIATATHVDASSRLSNTGKTKTPVVGHGNYRYNVDKSWGVQDNSKIPVDDCHEMVFDSNGRLILLNTHTKNNVIIYDKSGKVLKTWGHDFPGAHGLTLSQEGSEEFLFITDTQKHEVYKTDLNGNVVMKLGYPVESGVYTGPEEYKPTETAIAPNGDIYVADGYGLNYITQYNANGEYIRHFGGKGEGEDQFDCCHGVTLDTRKSNPDELLITSRSKQEFKRFTLDGRHIETIKTPGMWICRAVIAHGKLYFPVIVSKSWFSYDGFLIVLDENNKVVSAPGGSEPQYVDGKLQPIDYDGVTFFNPHDICVDDEENLYVPQWYSGRTYPYKLVRI